MEEHLVDREVVVRPGPERDAGQQEGVPLEVEGADDVDQALAREVGARPADRLDGGPRRGHPVDQVDVGDVGALREARDDLVEELHRGVLRPPRVGRVLDVRDGDHALHELVRALLRRRGEHGSRRGGRVPDGQLRLPAEAARVLQRLGCVLRRGEHREYRRPGHPQARDLGVDVEGVDVVRLDRDDLHVGAQDAPAEARQKLLPETVVLVEHADLRCALCPREVLAEDPALGGVRRPQADRVREPGGLRPERGRSGRREQLRHLPLVEVVAHGEVLIRPERVEDGEHAVLLDEPPRLGNRANGVGGVVAGDVVDPAAVDTALRVDVVEVRLRAARDRRVRRLRPRERRRPADEHRGRRHAGVGRAPRGGGKGRRCPGGEQEREREQRQDELSGHGRGGRPSGSSVVASCRSDGRYDVLGV